MTFHLRRRSPEKGLKLRQRKTGLTVTFRVLLKRYLSPPQQATGAFEILQPESSHRMQVFSSREMNFGS
ncbi:hypothetical protein Egran_06825 [Elaphomyces granulatus]|uniref:Uncharacterized protein n=1 Tax=Elaphomyces granulatus TaxID=519963 RepID=A0A232LNL4_9EURO|nr:hypothetical protein Egran_06825 [Elaphomyces granulatus]